MAIAVDVWFQLGPCPNLLSRITGFSLLIASFTAIIDCNGIQNIRKQKGNIEKTWPNLIPADKKGRQEVGRKKIGSSSRSAHTAARKPCVAAHQSGSLPACIIRKHRTEDRIRRRPVHADPEERNGRLAFSNPSFYPALQWARNPACRELSWVFFLSSKLKLVPLLAASHVSFVQTKLSQQLY